MVPGLPSRTVDNEGDVRNLNEESIPDNDNSENLQYAGYHKHGNEMIATTMNTSQERWKGIPDEEQQVETWEGVFFAKEK